MNDCVKIVEVRLLPFENTLELGVVEEVDDQPTLDQREDA